MVLYYIERGFFMKNSQINFYELNSKEYIDWVISLLNREPLQMITEKTYSNLMHSGSDLDKANLLNLDRFARSLNLYASNNYIHTNNLSSSDLEYCVHFSLVLKVDDMFLLVESASSTFNSYTFISTFNNYDKDDYIDWNLYSQNKPTKRIENILNGLNNVSSNLNKQISDILNSELFEDSNLTHEEKKDLVTKFILNNLTID